MPRYFFNVQDGGDLPDLQGAELADINVARKEAVRFAGALMNEDPNNFGKQKSWCMEVHDGSGFQLFTITAVADEAPSSERIPYIEAL